MIVIKQRETGKVLHRVDADTLVSAHLYGANLYGAHLGGAILTDANLTDAILTGANLGGANLTDANLYGAHLGGAILTDANLTDAILTDANLTDAILTGAILTDANLTDAILTGANLSGATCGFTIFAHCLTLSRTIGLEATKHWGTSSLDAVTLRACVNDLPDKFLQGVGYTNEEIENLRGMYGKGIQFYSCFLSYAHKDTAFADRLHADLTGKNVTCWRDVHDMKGGDFWRKQINDAIKMHDKLVVICSKTSLTRPEVVEEIIEAIEHERKTGTQKLFPVRIDDFIFTPEAETLAYETLPPRQRREDWLTYLRDYHVPDFKKWKNHDAYQKEFDKLLRDLKNPAKR